MQHGELIVTGNNKIVIPLNGFPAEARAHFKDDGRQPIPCDPGDADVLEYTVHASDTIPSGFVLIISWSVSSVREIKWHVSY